MPVVLEMHLTEGDRHAVLALRRRLLVRGYELPTIALLGQSLRLADPSDPDWSAAETELVQKLLAYANLLAVGAVDMVALDDGSRGRNTLDNAVAAELLIGMGADPARLLINLVARNRQAEQIRHRLLHFASLGIRNFLAITGDLPADGARAVFPLDSVGILELARSMSIEGQLPHDVWMAAAGHPNPDADPDGLRALHKVLAGASVIITQAIYSLEQFTCWMEQLRRVGVLDIAYVLAEIIPITSAHQLRMIADVPGIRVPESLMQELEAAEASSRAAGMPASTTQDRSRRAAGRITRTLLHQVRCVPGVSGFYLGCVKSFAPHLELLKESPLLPDHAEALVKPSRLTGAQRQRALAQLPRIESYVQSLLQSCRKREQRAGALRPWLQSGGVARALRILEWPKIPLFGCKKCDRCDLSADALICPRGCAKQMTHGPCGAPKRIGGRVLCEDTSRECTWAAILDARRRYNLDVVLDIEFRPAPSAEFYQGVSLSAVLPVLQGAKEGPDWSLPWKAVASRLHKGSSARDPATLVRDLLVLARSREENMRQILHCRPNLDAQEALIKLLALIGSPEATFLMESQFAGLGLPAEGALHDLSIREKFQLAEALPRIRQRNKSSQNSHTLSTTSHADELLSAVPEGRQLRKAIRRELAGRLIEHIASLGVPVSFAAVCLDRKYIEEFLAALAIFRDELQIARSGLEPRTVSVHFLAIHYKRSFHAAIGLCEATATLNSSAQRFVIEVDLKQFRGPSVFRSQLRCILESLSQGAGESEGTILLEDFAPASQSCVWKLNAEFWRRLPDFEAATGIRYDDSIGGSSDQNLAYARSAARAYFDRAERFDFPSQQVAVLEIGVASTHRAKAFLTELRRLCELHGRNHLESTTYLLADFSAGLLEQAAADLRSVHPLVQTIRIDAGNPFGPLAAFQGKITHAHLCNVYDNLPADQYIWLDGAWRRVESRLYSTQQDFERICKTAGLPEHAVTRLHSLLSNLNRAGQNAASDLLEEAAAQLEAAGKPRLSYVAWWIELFSILRFDERYVPAPHDATFEVSGVGLLPLSAMLDAHAQAAPPPLTRIHVNLGALAGFAQLLSLLHPHGVLEVIDLFVHRTNEYTDAFKGPAKYDGSIVNWLNGPLFRAVAAKLGGNVRFQSFRPFDPKSVSVVMLAEPSGNAMGLTHSGGS